MKHLILEKAKWYTDLWREAANALRITCGEFWVWYGSPLMLPCAPRK